MGIGNFSEEWWNYKRDQGEKFNCLFCVNMQTDANLKADIQKAVDNLNTLISQTAYKGLTIKYDIWDNNQIGVPNYPIINVKLKRIQEI